MKNLGLNVHNWNAAFRYVQSKMDCFKPFENLSGQYLPCMYCTNCKQHITNFLNKQKNDNSTKRNN